MISLTIDLKFDGGDGFLNEQGSNQYERWQPQWMLCLEGRIRWDHQGPRGRWQLCGDPRREEEGQGRQWRETNGPGPEEEERKKQIFEEDQREAYWEGRKGKRREEGR